ncbi:MAG: 7TM diverse intracellular signaling domain-containing protein, partial [Bacteroidota bacterium]
NFATYQQIPLKNDYHRVLKTTGCYWARVQIKNNLKRDTDWYMLVGTGADIDVYYAENDRGYIQKKTGIFTRVNERDVKDERGNKVKIFVPVGEENITVYLRLIPAENLYNYFNIALKSPDEWHNFIYERNLIQGFFQGVLWIMLLYNLTIYLSLKDKTYLFYALYMLSLAILFYNYFDFNKDPVFSNFPWLTVYVSFAASCLVTVFYFQFLRLFLQTKEVLPKWDRIIVIWMGIRILFMLSGFLLIGSNVVTGFPYENSESIYFIESVFNFIILISIYKKGSIVVRYFILGTFSLYLGVLLAAIGWSNALVEIGIAGSNSAYFIQGGAVLEILAFSVGLGYRIRMNEREKQSYQEKLILQLRENELLQSKTTLELEDKVKERTHEIESQKTEIISQSEKLKVANKEVRAQKEVVEEAYSKLKAAQESMVRSEKMASLGQLTAGIAHEINNPINFVSSNIKPLKRDFAEIKELLESYFKLNPTNDNISQKLTIVHQKKELLDAPFLLDEVEKLLKGIEIGANRTKNIVSGLRSFSRLNEDTIKKASVHNGINNTLLLLGNKMKHNVEVSKHFGDDIPNIECYPGQLNQVFMNLLDNAIYAVNGKGKITISTQNVNNSKKEMVEIAFADNGEGMPKDVLDHIFEPFFTTKEVGKGSGLGLSITYGIIQQHKGNISVKSEPKKGTTFYIHLP